jgi:hypothetical protein
LPGYSSIHLLIRVYIRTINLIKMSAPATTDVAPVRQPSSCQVCFQPGHCYRACSDPTIEATHLQGVEMYRQLLMSHNDITRQTNVQSWAMNLTRGMMRVLLARYTMPHLLSEFESIQAWRTWRAQTSLTDRIYIPARLAIQGLANMDELRFMIDISYTALAQEIIVADIDSMEIMAANDHIAQMRSAFILFSRNMRHANLTGYGVQNYAQDIIHYLETIIEQQETRSMFPHIPVPLMREEYLNDPLPPMVHIPMPRPARVMEEHPDFVSMLPRRGLAQRQPTFTIDLRLSVPPAADAEGATDAAVAEDPVQCGICWDELNDESRIITNCNHNYCDGCVTAQLDSIRAKYRRSGDICRYLDLNCALCRQNVHTLSHNMSDDAKIRGVKDVLYHGSDPQIDVAL